MGCTTSAIREVNCGMDINMQAPADDEDQGPELT